MKHYPSKDVRKVFRFREILWQYAQHKVRSKVRAIDPQGTLTSSDLLDVLGTCVLTFSFTCAYDLLIVKANLSSSEEDRFSEDELISNIK